MDAKRAAVTAGAVVLGCAALWLLRAETPEEAEQRRAEIRRQQTQAAMSELMLPQIVISSPGFIALVESGRIHSDEYRLVRTADGWRTRAEVKAAGG